MMCSGRKREEKPSFAVEISGERVLADLRPEQRFSEINLFVQLRPSPSPLPHDWQDACRLQ